MAGRSPAQPRGVAPNLARRRVGHAHAVRRWLGTVRLRSVGVVCALPVLRGGACVCRALLQGLPVAGRRSRAHRGDPEQQVDKCIAAARLGIFALEALAAAGGGKTGAAAAVALAEDA